MSYFSLSGYHIMLDPAGDCKNPGRSLATCTERGITLQICEAIKEQLQITDPTIKITITHKAGESVTQEQRAQITNKSDANLFIHISCFEDISIKPRIMCYYHQHTGISYQPKACTLIPADKAHECCFSATKKYTEQLYIQLKKECFSYTLFSPCAIPDARLKYIQIPSFAIEIGVSTSLPWTNCIDFLCSSLIVIAKNMS